MITRCQIKNFPERPTFFVGCLVGKYVGRFEGSPDGIGVGSGVGCAMNKKRDESHSRYEYFGERVHTYTPRAFFSPFSWVAWLAKVSEALRVLQMAVGWEGDMATQRSKIGISHIHYALN